MVDIQVAIVQYLTQCESDDESRDDDTRHKIGNACVCVGIWDRILSRDDGG